MALSLTPRSLAHASARHPWWVVGSWLALLVVSFGLIGAFLESALTTEATTSGKSGSRSGDKLLSERLRGPQKDNEAVVVRSANLTVDNPAFRSQVESLYNQIDALPGVVDSGTNYYQSGLQSLVSANRKTTVMPITLTGDFDTATTNVKQIIKIVEGANGKDGFEVYVSGNASVGQDFNTASENDIARGETIGGIIALVILVLVFGALVSALVPLILAIAAILAALGLTALVGQGYQLSFFVENMITMMGLAVGIDYSLFILSRFREELQRGRSVLEAIDVSSETSGHAVFFSGLTVIIALAGMLIVPSSIYRSLAAGAIFVVAFAILASLTLLPALMRLLGANVNRLRLPFIQKAQAEFDEERRGGFWDKVASTVMHHPVIGVVAVTTVLLLCAVPYFDINAGSAGVSTLPDSFQSKKGFQVLAQDFAGGQVYPAEIVLDGDVNAASVKPAVDKLTQLIANDKDFGPVGVAQTNQAGDVALIDVQMPSDPYADSAGAALKRLRSDYIPQAFAGTPVKVYVTGLTAVNVDSLSMTSHYTPIVFVFVLGLSFLLLMVVFRSIVVPAKAIVMNLLSVGAAYGLLVLVSQKGVGANILGFQQVDTIEFWLPLFLFSVLFGLSMDYHVFLLSRIRERYTQTGDNTEAVAYGLRSTGRLITGAALIMVAVFGGFAMGDLVMLQQVGFGLGVAVLIDATIIRSILVPASMRLLGKVNWYLPPVLSWLPRIGIEQVEAPRGGSAPEAAR